ncbi:DUF6231 family protein [Pseudomonas kuykendallii]|uniref:Uncharacterized protein n=1 Tax=Pseudomonas kuykendallii TaxID=1007099 RepID=A0A2W5CWF7_9PSED|nr:DUF6231 family protein [Pseudomonas kuykendallii]PZP23671.1 MAG: hypothetical protein DI599_10685 [Pseudomonas kuykendallii]
MTESFSQRTPQQALAALLESQAPERLLSAGASDLPALQAYRDTHPSCQMDYVPPGPLPAVIAVQRYALAVVADCLEHLPKRSGLELLGGIRNLNAHRLAVLVDLGACDWQATDFYSLGMQASERFRREAQILTLFTYDLHDYKQVPDWLNARFWANPENFGKYWW